MAQDVTEKGDPQGAPEEDEPTGRCAGGAMVYDHRATPMAGTGNDKNAEASNIKVRGRRPQ